MPAQDPSFVSDAYAECYPSYHEMGAVMVESDDEDLGQMDAKVWGGGRGGGAHEGRGRTRGGK